MGSLCNPGIQKIPADETSQPHSKQVVHVETAQSMAIAKFSFTNQKLIHLNGDLLIIFMDHSTNLRKNDHFIKLPLQASKLEEFLNAAITKKQVKQQKQFSQQKFMTFSIMVPTLNYKKVSLIFCNTWLNGVDDKSNFETLFSQYIQTIIQIDLKSIVITEFTSQLGIPLQKGAKIVIKQLLKLSKKPERIQFVCLSEQSKGLFIDVINENKDNIIQSFLSQHSTSSNYF